MKNDLNLVILKIQFLDQKIFIFEKTIFPKIKFFISIFFTIFINFLKKNFTLSVSSLFKLQNELCRAKKYQPNQKL